ncbi:MAG TPA: hypothetical protein VHZ75_02975 [Solirubrobacteraceae bacterium]|jgi:hypothetical protein|nr:hypothetical protein [Solirubrobacteraceae bacterium]
MGYKMLGFVVWHGARWYARRRVTQAMPSRRTVSIGALAVGLVGAGAVVAARRGD